MTFTFCVMLCNVDVSARPKTNKKQLLKKVASKKEVKA